MERYRSTEAAKTPRQLRREQRRAERLANREARQAAKEERRAARAQRKLLREAKRQAKENLQKSDGKVSVIWTDRPIRLIAQGEECSEIKWLDTGSYQALPNDQLRFRIKK